jgi:serine/threonine-protein kinase HipA
MARRAGVEMTECRLLEENGRRHFMTRRFDRSDDGGKLHMQTLGALEHVSYNEPGAYSYEQALLLVRDLTGTMRDVEQLYRRMVFNVVARNHDDHVKNTALTMDRAGRWRLAPAYDLTWAYRPGNVWLDSHQMTINGKRDGITRADLRRVAELAGLKRGRADAILAEVVDAVRAWPEIAAAQRVDPEMAERIAATHRLALPAG